MPSRPARVLCVGKDLELLQTRCAVLMTSGYDAQPATLPEAEILLRTGQFDLVVVSAWLSEWERGKILSSTGKTPIHVLSGFTVASQLLEAVERLLPRLAED
jgi:hypothetical protein